MTSATQEAPVKQGAKVRISQGDDKNTQLTGTITRIWAKPSPHPYVTVKTDDGRTFVRDSRAVKEI